MTTREPKYTKKLAALQLGVSLYRLNRFIDEGLLPKNPTMKHVEAFIRRNRKDVEAFRKSVREADDEGHSIEFCIEMVKNAVDTGRLILPGKQRPDTWVYKILYDKAMEGKRHGNQTDR